MLLCLHMQKRKKIIPFIQDVSLDLMELFAKEAAGFEGQAAPLSGPVPDNTQLSVNTHTATHTGGTRQDK